jgi:hypothetical protein
MLKTIKYLTAFDFDGTLMNTPNPENGVLEWERVKGEKYPNKGWWSFPESLDLDVFDIKPFPLVLEQLIKEKQKSDSHVIISTSRIEKLRPQLEAILNKNNIQVDDVLMKDSLSKGDKILKAIRYMPDLREINVYDDREVDIQSYKAIRDKIPENIIFNVYMAKDGNFSLIGNQNGFIGDIINDEINDFIIRNKNNRIYRKD